MAAQKKYICAFCARAFTRSEHKQRHERSHTNEKPFHCTSCLSLFVRRDLLQRHCRTVHSIPTVGDNKRQKLLLVEEEETVLPPAEKPHPVTKTETLNHDLIQLLSILRKLEYILGSENFDANLNDYFLIGYVELSALLEIYTLLDRTLKELLSFLRGYNEQDESELSQKNFKTGVIYTIVSLGYICNHDHTRSMFYFLKAWNLLIKTLIPNYNNNNNLFDQIEILNNLFLLAYTYLQYDLGKYESTEEDTTVSNSVILNYLNDISSIINANLSSVSPSNLIDLNISLFWNIYILLSTYLKPLLPKMYSFFVHRKINEVDTLSSFMVKLLKQVVNFDDMPEDSQFLKLVVIATLGNELKNSCSSEPLLIYDLKNTLHNAVILINKSINTISTTEKYHIHKFNNHAHKSKIFELFKKDAIINSPPKFHELLSNYLFIPSQFYQWDLLSVTLQEVTVNYPLTRYFHDYIQASHYSDITLHVLAFFQFKEYPIDINNNLSIISFPLIFFNNFLNLKLVSLQQYNLLQLKSIGVFLMEWYLIMNKTLIMTWNLPELFDSNYILQNLLFLLLDNKQVLASRLNMSNQLETTDEDFCFNHKWFWVLKLKVDSIFESWMEFLRVEVNSKFGTIDRGVWTNVSTLKGIVCKFIDELAPLELAKLADHTNGSSHSRAEMPRPPVFINYSSEHESQNKYRRANSISLGGLGQHAYNNSDAVSPHNSLSSSVVESRKNSIGKISSGKSGYYNTSYTYPPLPVLTTQPSQPPPQIYLQTLLQMSQPPGLVDPYVLPPLLRRQNGSLGSVQQGVSNFRNKNVLERS